MNPIQFGWSDFFARSFRPFADAGLEAARVAVQHRGGYLLYSVHGDLTAEVSGRFRHEAFQLSNFPAVGDWVAVEPAMREARAVIHAVLPRRTRISRTNAGGTTEEQLLAANVDDAYIVAALGGPVNLRRIERYLTLAWESGADPVVALTKADLCSDLEQSVARVEQISGGAPVLTLSTVTGLGMDALSARLGTGRTGVLLGPSGVGKSTLINHLCGDERLAVQPVREDDQKGRHTTTHRELILLPAGGLIIDTPGLRELQLWEGGEGVNETFGDIEAYAAECRFADCRHEMEPGCAVLRAIESGALDAARLESHRKLKREVAYFERRHDARAQSQLRRRSKVAAKFMRAHKKSRE